MEYYEKIKDFRLALIYAIHNSVNYEYSNFDKIINAIHYDYKKDYLTFSLDDPTQVSYSLKGGIPYDEKQRRRTKLGRYLKRVFGDELKIMECTDSQLDEFVNNVLQYSPQKDGSFELLQGKDIITAYKNAVGGSTCMTGKDSLVSIYGSNDNIRMLIYQHTKKSRALVWTCDDGTIVMDRIYPNSGSHIKIMQKYAVDQGWVYRIISGLPDGNVPLSDNDTHHVTVESPNRRWPYMDTFRFATGSSTKSTLSNMRGNGDYNSLLESTEGYYDE